MGRLRRFLFTNSSLHQTLAKNTAWLFGGEIMSRLLKMFLVIYAARVLGVNEWGIFSYALSLGGLLYIFSDFGLEHVITRELAKNSEKKLEYLSTAFVIRFSLLILSLIIILAIAPYISSIADIRSILLPIALVLAFDSLRNLGLAISRALEKMEIEAYMKTITSLVISVLGLAFLFFNPSIYHLASAYLIGSSLGLILTFFALRSYFIQIPQFFSRKAIVPLLKISWPFFLFWITSSIMYYTDVIILGWMKTPTELGLYSSAQRLIQFLMMVPSLIGLATLPLFSKLVLEDINNLRQVLRKTISIVMFFAVPISLSGLILAKDLIIMIFGEAYIGSTQAFQIFLIHIIISFPLLIVNNYIFVQDKQKRFVVYNIGAALLNVILNLLLIPQFGIYGASFASVFSGIILGIITFSLAKVTFLKDIQKIIWASILTSISTLLFHELGFHTLIIVMMSTGIYLSLIYFFKEKLIEDVKKIFKKQGLNLK